MPTSKRLFVAIELPPECKTALLDLDPRLPGLRWLPEAQMHLTLSFLGEVESEKQDALADALHEVPVPPFFLPLAGVGAFNARGRPSVVWAGVGKGHPHLFALHQHIQDAVLRAGHEPDLRPFRPHVTIARATGISKQSLQPFLKRYRETEFALFQVTEFALFSSILHSEGAVHQMEFRVGPARGS
jgi:RNA 2',3'-cyclic 3'-phosphodiesterase